MLLTRDVKPSSQYQVMTDFQTHFVESGILPLSVNFKDHVLRINKNEPTEEFAIEYLEDSKKFLEDVMAYRSTEKEVIEK